MRSFVLALVAICLVTNLSACARQGLYDSIDGLAAAGSKPAAAPAEGGLKLNRPWPFN